MSLNIQNDLQQPVASLIDDLKCDDVGRQVAAVSKLHTVAVALGPDRSRSELITFIQTSMLNEEDEVAAELAGQLDSTFLKLLGGQQPGENFHLLTPIYEALLGSEESTVRNKTVASIKDVLDTIDHAQVTEHVFKLFDRLSSSTEWFTKKSCAASLAGILISYLGKSERDRVMERFRTSLFPDENPIVRRAALMACKSIFSNNDLFSNNQSSSLEWLEMLKTVINDPQDSVRLLIVEPLALIGQFLDHATQIDQIYPLEIQLIGDMSWRVRYMAATAYPELMRGVGLEIPDFNPLIAFCSLLTDYEAEVRVAAAGQIARVAELWPVEATFTEGLLPTLRQLVIDQNQEVRAALALQLNSLSQVAGKEATMSELLPLFLQLFQDDSSKVRLNVISRLDVINRVIGVEHLSQALVPAIVKLTEDALWTVRQAIIEYIPVVSEHLGVQFFDSQLLNICAGLLDDPVYAVRQSTIALFEKIGSLFGTRHFAEKCFPVIVKYAEHTNYLRRITFLMAVAKCASIFTEIDQSVWFPSVERLSKDPIANVRINAAKVAKKLPFMGDILGRLREDEDEDVRFYAS